MKVTLECHKCEKQFTRYPSQMKDTANHYCSKECTQQCRNRTNLIVNTKLARGSQFGPKAKWFSGWGVFKERVPKGVRRKNPPQITEETRGRQRAARLRFHQKNPNAGAANNQKMLAAIKSTPGGWEAMLSRCYENSRRWAEYIRQNPEKNPRVLALAEGRVSQESLVRRGMKKSYYTSEKCGVLFCASSYERRLAGLLDSNPEVVRFTRFAGGLWYTLNRKLRMYIPDFIAWTRDGSGFVIEVKAAWALGLGETVAKIEAGVDFCSKNDLTYTVVTEDELGLVVKR